MMNDSTSMIRLRRFVDSATEGICSLDKNLRIDFVNQYMLDLMGYPRKELLGNPIKTFIFESDLEEHNQHMDVACQGVSEHYQQRLRRKDGTPLWVKVCSSVVSDDEDHFAGAFLILSNSAKPNQVGQAFTRSEQNLTDYMANIEGFFYTFRMTSEGHYCFPYASPGIEKLYGLKPADVMEDRASLHLLAHPDDRSRIDAKIHQSARTMTPFHCEFRICRPGLPERWIEARSIPRHEADGSILWYGLMLDVDERKQTEQRVALLSFALNKVHEAAFLIDEEAHFCFVNEEACRQLGYSHDELLHMQVPDIDAKFPREAWPEHWARLKRERSLLFESQHRDSEGVIFPVEIKANLIEYEQKYYDLALARNISERKQVENALRLACDAAQAANQAKNLFLANMSHELHTPLTAILGFSSLLHDAPNLTDSQRRDIEIINQSGAQLLALLRDVLEITKIESGKLQLEITPFDLAEMIDSIQEIMQLRAQRKGLKLVMDQSPRVPRYISGDEARIRQILVNLLGNAVKFTEQGEVTLRLDLNNDLEHHLLIEVKDNGPGISPENQKRLFQPFVQFIRGAALSGTGLGLSITYHLVQLMHGEISVDSKLGKGATFRVELPLLPASEEDVQRLGKRKQGGVTGLAPGQPVYRILIADDRYDNQLLLLRLLQAIGLEARSADNGDQCVQICQDWLPDLIWMAHSLPALNGIEATRRVRELPGGQKVRIVAVTTSVYKDQQSQFTVAGMDDVVFKPYATNEIYDCLARQLGLKFIYAPIRAMDQAEGQALTLQGLAKLPEVLRLELSSDLKSLNNEQIIRTVGRISKIDPLLGKTLNRLVSDYNYPEILATLSKLGANSMN